MDFDSIVLDRVDLSTQLKTNICAPQQFRAVVYKYTYAYIAKGTPPNLH